MGDFFGSFCGNMSLKRAVEVQSVPLEGVLVYDDVAT